MSLDQILIEVEPIFRGTDGAFQFSHPSFQEVLTARQFADEINSGRLSVREACTNFWSFESSENWYIPGGGLYKVHRYVTIKDGWSNILVLMAGLLKKNEADGSDYSSQLIIELASILDDSRPENLSLIIDCSNEIEELSRTAEEKIYGSVEKVYLGSNLSPPIPDCDEHWQGYVSLLDRMGANAGQMLLRWLNKPYMADVAIELIGLAMTTPVTEWSSALYHNEALQYVRDHVTQIPVGYQCEIRKRFK